MRICFTQPNNTPQYKKKRLKLGLEKDAQDAVKFLEKFEKRPKISLSFCYCVFPIPI